MLSEVAARDRRITAGGAKRTRRRGATSACRRVARCAAAALAWIGLAVAPPAGAQAPTPLPVVEAAPGVFVHVAPHEEASPDNLGDIANVGFVVGERCVAVIDTGGSLAGGRALLAALRARTDRPVCYVVNTHMHPDHVLGNAAFAEAPEEPHFVGSAALPAALASHGGYYLDAAKGALGALADGTRLVPPDIVVDGERRLDLGGRTLVLRRWPTAHTDNDLTVFDEATGTLWLSDLLFQGRIPSVDGSIKGWLAVIGELRGVPAKRVIPGHGALGLPWPAALDAEAAYLAGIVQRVREALGRGLTLRQTVDAADPAKEAAGWQLAEGYHRRNVTAAYAELEWE